MGKSIKVFFFKAIIIFATSAVLSSCSDDDSVTIEIEEEDVADIVASSLSDEDGGLVNDIENLVENAEEECGYMETETFSDTETIGVRTFSLDYDISLQVICDENQNFLQVEYNYTVDREAELVRLNVTSEATGDWLLQALDERYLFEGDYVYRGEETFKVRSQNSYNSSLTTSTSDL